MASALSRLPALRSGATLLCGLLLGFSLGAALAQNLQPGRTGGTPPVQGASPAVDGVSIRDAEWFDAARQRMVPVRIYLPAAGPSPNPENGRLPLVVFSHGLGGSRMGYSQFGRHFAQHGFVALHLQHAGSDRAVWQGGPFAILGNMQEAASEGNALARAQDASFAITALLADPHIGARIDPLAIAVAGHSYGANTAMLLAGASVERNGRRISVADARVKAAILLSAPPFHGEGDQAAVLRDVRIPTLHLTGTEDEIRVPGYRSDPVDRIGVFRDMPAAAGMKHLAIFEGGEHSVFTDRTRTERAMAIKAAARDLSLAFLRANLRQQAGAVERALEGVRSLLTPPEQVLSRRFDAQLRTSAY